MYLAFSVLHPPLASTLKLRPYPFVLSRTCLYIALSASSPKGDPNLTLRNFVDAFSNNRGILCLTDSGLIIPIVRDVIDLGNGNPKSSFKGSFAFLAFKSHKAISNPA